MSEDQEDVISRPFLRYTIAVVAIVIAFLMRQFMVRHLGAELPHYITFYPAVVLVAILAGLGPGLLATVVALLLTAYWILPPQGQFAIEKTSDAIGLIFFSGMGVFISVLATLYRRSRRKAAAYDKELALRGAQEALLQSEERLRSAAMAAEIGVWNWNLRTGELVVSANWKRVFGIVDDINVTVDNWLNALHPEDRDRVVNARNAVIDQRHLWDSAPEYDIDYRVIWPNGRIRWLVDRGRVSYDENGQPNNMAGVNVDITERKRAEEAVQASLVEKTALLNEVHHRVKNNLQIVSSLLSLQANQQVNNPAALEVLRDTQGRIRSMALLHEALYRDGNAARVNCEAYLGQLCTQLCRAFSPLAERVQIKKHIASVGLGLDLAIPCGLIVNELVSNAFKHAFPGERHGEITVELYAEANDRIVLSVCDDGVGLSPGHDCQPTSTLGMQLVAGLAQQIHATIETKCNPGAAFKISFSVHADEGQLI